MDVKDLKKFEETVAACNRCGFCTSFCPTYNATGNEAHSPRGRNQAFRALIEGRISDPSQIQESVDTCLLCGECTSVCFSEVPTAQLMVQARELLKSRSDTKLLRLFLENVLFEPKRLRWFLKLAFFGKRFGAAWLLRKTGLLDKFAPILAAADDLVTQVPLRFLLDYPAAKFKTEQQLRETAHAKIIEEQKTAGVSKPVTDRPKVAYFPACGTQYLKPGAGLATLGFCRTLGVEVVIPDVVCCGLPAQSQGLLENARTFAKRNIERIERGRYEAVLVDDSSCTAHLKEYPKLFQSDPAWLARAHEVAQKVRDVPTFFLQRGILERVKKLRWSGGPVAFHDPCKMQYGLKSTQVPRDILLNVTGLKLVPVPDADQCCGGAGTFSFTHPEMSQEVLKAKIRNIISSGCSVVVTTSVSCLIQLQFGLRKENSKIEAMHLTEFLARAGKASGGV